MTAVIMALGWYLALSFGALALYLVAFGFVQITRRLGLMLHARDVAQRRDERAVALAELEWVNAILRAQTKRLRGE